MYSLREYNFMFLLHNRRSMLKAHVSRRRQVLSVTDRRMSIVYIELDDAGQIF